MKINIYEAPMQSKNVFDSLMKLVSNLCSGNEKSGFDVLGKDAEEAGR